MRAFRWDRCGSGFSSGDGDHAALGFQHPARVRGRLWPGASGSLHMRGADRINGPEMGVRFRVWFAWCIYISLKCVDANIYTYWDIKLLNYVDINHLYLYSLISQYNAHSRFHMSLQWVTKGKRSFPFGNSHWVAPQWFDLCSLSPFPGLNEWWWFCASKFQATNPNSFIHLFIYLYLYLVF